MACDGNAEQRRHLLVLARRLELLADQGALEQPILERDERKCDADDDEILAVEIDRPHLKARRIEPPRQHLRLRTVERKHAVGEKDGSSDCRDQHRQKAAMAQRIIDGQIEDRPEHCHPCDRNKKREPVGPAKVDREHDHEIGGDHRELALGEIDNARRPKNQDEPQSDKGIDGADADAGEKQLQKEIHADQRASRGSGAQTPVGALRRRTISP